MSGKRKKPTDNLEIILHSQVGNICPLCTKPLTEKKIKNIIKKSEIAHIYPLNPTPEETNVLKGEEILNSDLNHEDNLIPLCFDCHNRYDKKKTVEEYRILISIKKQLINQDIQKSIWHQYALQKEIIEIIDELIKIDASSLIKLSYEPKKIDEKLNDTITQISKRKIHLNVQDYFQLIKDKLSNIERESPTKAELISIQIKTFYLLQKDEGKSQELVYKNISNWIMHKTNQASIDSSEILAAFFIQNCEIFE